MNYIALLVTAIVGYIIGALWYSPLLFGKLWCKLSGFTKKDMNKAKNDGKMWIRYVTMFVSTLIMTAVLAIFTAGETTFNGGALIGGWIWLGFLATTMLGMVLWNNKPFKLYVVMTGHYLVALVIMGGMLGVWR